ncbi:hypothetical protein M9434_004826 [Picochlorum sp. BPE23]|nr:hypothetical protein M9434_004826 [Picochlorum sp. BPE23]
MAHVVHHSTWPLETLVAMILDKLMTSYIPGERVSVEGKQGTFKVLEQEDTTGMYVLQPAAGGDRVSVESSAIQKRSASSIVSRVNADGVLEWVDQSAWCGPLGDAGEDSECFWRMKRYFRKLYNLEESIPEEFEGKVTFPVERDESGERDEYQPSDSDAEMPDADAAELAVKTRRKSKKMRRDGISESDVDIEGDEPGVDLNTLEFDGRPLKDGLLAFLLEGFEDTQKRMSSNEDKLAIFNILADVDEDGLFVDEIIAVMKENDCILPEEMKDTRDHVNGICNSDAAFFKCPAGKYCLTAHVAASVAKSLGPIFVQYSNGADLKSRSGRRASPISKIEVRQIESLRRLAEQCSRNVRTRNTKCPRCHRLTKSDKVTFKTRNCNTCPRAYHQECLDESEMRYPVDSWSCSKCIETAQSVIRKLLDLEEKKKEAEAQNEKKLQVAERKQRKRMNNRKSTKLVEGERKGVPKRKISDWDALDEEKKSIKVVEAKLRELRGLADVIDPVDDDALTVNSTEIQKAEMELARLKSVIVGPPQEYPRLFKDDKNFSSFNEAAGVAEFVSLYGDICELEEIFDTPDLLLSTRWPLDHARGLVPLYSQLLLCCLLEQLNRDPPMRSRARKWTRMLTNVTWPEVLRKYIEITRRPTEKELEEGIYQPKPDSPPRGLFSDDYSKLQEEASRYLTTKGWWEMPAELQLSLLSALCYDISQGYTLKADMGEKIQDCAKISTDFSKVLSQARKLRKDKVSEDRRRKTGGTENGSEDDDDNDDDDDFEEDISLHVQEKESQAEERLSTRAFRTECMGVDRYGRRYWWLRGSQAILLVEDAEGHHAGIIKSKETLDALMTSLIRRGPKEGNLLRRLRRFYKRICASFLEQDTKNLVMDSIDRPTPTDGRQKQRSLEDLAASATNEALSEAKSKIDDILSEIVTSEIELAADLKGYRKELRSLENASQVCDFLLRIEAILSIAGEGLPPYASNENMPMFLGEDAAAKLPPMNITEPIKGEVKQTENDDLKKEENPDVNITEDENDTKDAMHENGSEEIDHVTALIQENPLFKALKPFISLPAPVSCDDDYDCSEAEHTYLREKRMRKPARLWRSGRERAVWLKSVLRAAASPPAVGVVQATCCAFILGDRVNLLIERCIALEKEIARWEAEEEERQQAEIQLQKEKSQQMLPPQERPMMIRTGKAKTDSGVKIVLKLIGREAFPQGRNATTAMDVMASDEDVAKCSTHMTTGN